MDLIFNYFYLKILEGEIDNKFEFNEVIKNRRVSRECIKFYLNIYSFLL